MLHNTAHISSLAQTEVRSPPTASQQEDEDDEESGTTDTTTTTKANYGGEEVDRSDDPTYAMSQGVRKFPDMSDPVKYGTTKAVQYDVLTPKARKRAGKYSTDSGMRDNYLADQNEERHTGENFSSIHLSSLISSCTM